MTERLYKWSFAELLDRVSIVQMKIVFSETEEMRQEFISERDAIVHDLNAFIKEGVEVTGEILVAAMALQMVNHAIWTNESGSRGDGEAKNYELSHSLNSDRATIKKHISQKANGRIDHKLNYGMGTWDFAL
jgi:hypothetical protein